MIALPAFHFGKQNHVPVANREDGLDPSQASMGLYVEARF
jgi:hypothetical protein